MNEETCRGISGKIKEMLKRRPVNTYCLQETRFTGKAVKVIKTKTTQNKLLWIRNNKGLSRYSFSGKI